MKMAEHKKTLHAKACRVLKNGGCFISDNADFFTFRVEYVQGVI